jgi:hypothetical protein
MNKKDLQWCFSIGFLIMLAACTTLASPIPSSPTISVAQPTMSLEFIPTETSTPPVVIAPSEPTPEKVIGGGTIQDGSFIFDLRLLRDPTFSQQPVAASVYSDLNGVGAYLYWVYQGPEAIGPVQTYWGTLPHFDQLIQATYTSINQRSSGGRTGGVLLPGGSFLPGESKVGDQIQVALKVQTPIGEYGAVLHFTLNQDANGFEPIDISVGVLPPGN